MHGIGVHTIAYGNLSLATSITAGFAFPVRITAGVSTDGSSFRLSASYGPSAEVFPRIIRQVVLPKVRECAHFKHCHQCWCLDRHPDVPTPGGLILARFRPCSSALVTGLPRRVRSLPYESDIKISCPMDSFRLLVSEGTSCLSKACRIRASDFNKYRRPGLHSAELPGPFFLRSPCPLANHRKNTSGCGSRLYNPVNFQHKHTRESHCTRTTSFMSHYGAQDTTSRARVATDTSRALLLFTAALMPSSAPKPFRRDRQSGLRVRVRAVCV